MVDPQASRFWQAALQSGLIDAEGLNACFEAILPEKRVAEQLDRRLARQAVQQGRLTLWQAQQLLAGRSSGFKINRYTLLEMIGQGGMGRVYLARDTRLNRRVALKILSPERMNNPRAIARFQREARVGAQLQHENLVRIYDEGESNGKCYLVMEYIEGKNIGAIIAENGPIPPATAAGLARQVALGLEHAQRKGLIHRDVNPYNILVTREGVAKLTDLGLAIDQSEEAQVTRDGATVGTFDYVSPEQARHSHSVDTRSDIYSLGCTLYHMLTGQVPFPSPSLPEKLFGHQAIEPTPITSIVPGVPTGLEAVVQKMMRKSPDDRYPTPLDVADALEPFTAVPAPGAGPSGSEPGGGAMAKASKSATQIVSAPRLTLAVEGQSAGMAAGVVIPGTAAVLSSSAVSPTSPATPPTTPAGVTPRSNVDWGELGLGINLGPEPSLTEGLQSHKKKGRSASLSAEDGLPDAWSGSSALTTPEPEEVLPRGETTPPGAATAPDGSESTSRAGSRANLVVSPDLDSGPRPSKPSATPDPAVPARAQARPSVKRRSRNGWLIGAGVLGGTAIVAGAILGSGLLGQTRTPGPGSSIVASVAATGRPAPNDSVLDPEQAPSRSRPRATAPAEVPGGHPFVVKTPDGRVVVEATLKGAMQRAIGSKGHVLLSNREPLKLTGTDASINISGGRLTLRAAEGTTPVVEVELKGATPFLAARTDTPLTIVGVSFIVRHAASARGAKGAPSLIEAG